MTKAEKISKMAPSNNNNTLSRIKNAILSPMEQKNKGVHAGYVD
jgi:hypothetical protein